MIDYDFSTLNDKEFENLSIDLISKDKNKRFERFKAGKDGGIDGRFYHDDGLQDIVQCKHYLKTGFDGLMSSLKKKNDKGINEVDKVKKLNPLKYIFITSLPLSAENKKIIKKLFDPYIKNDNNIYGQEDLNQILGNHPDIEKRHYKLWLSSTVVLDRIINNAIESRSEFLLEDIKEKSKYYAVTENHQKAIDKLEESHIIIIAGEPGIGKTTLAEHLALWYIEQEYKFYNIENPINEAENIYKRDEKQIFYFNDFLGANYLNAIEDKKDSHIVKFMDRIKKDKTKRFILTSRTNIFNQGLALSDTFRSKNIENEEFIIKIESLKDIDKAHILYNHIWHSDLDEEFIDEIYVDKRYKQIIKHKNFNPRLIAFITDTQKIQKEQIEAKNYWNYIVDKLDNPQDVWQSSFDEQSDDFTRTIVKLTVFNGNKIAEDKLRDSYNRYIELAGLINNSNSSKEFDSVIKKLVGYFLNRTLKHDKTVEYSLFNPSVADFVLNRYKNNHKVLIAIFRSLQTSKALESLYSLYHRNYMKHELYKEILDSIDYGENTNIDFLVKLVNMIYNEFEEEKLTDNEKLNFENKIHSIMKIISIKKENIESRNLYLLLQTIYYPYYEKKVETFPKIINKIILSMDYENESDMREVMNFFEDNQIDLSSQEFQTSFQYLQNSIDEHFKTNYDKPSFLTKNAISKIEQIILEDIEEQSEEWINQHLEDIGLSKYSYENSQNIKYIKDKLDILKIKSYISEEILQNVSDRITSELFYKTNTLPQEDIIIKQENSNNDNNAVDIIDELFERQL